MPPANHTSWRGFRRGEYAVQFPFYHPTSDKNNTGRHLCPRRHLGCVSFSIRRPAGKVNVIVMLCCCVVSDRASSGDSASCESVLFWA
ncbi:hypothetical protein BaRGS_00004400 [Batillaria attramentaria]|uniref:Uncharacterized protein n=1 Tax=Batillaria attramentaria TaxID=370345 RepID=A0ABD0LZT8_9CAEN